MHHFTEGDTAIVDENHKVFTYKDGDWVAPIGSEITFSLMELNEQLMDQMPDFEDIEKFKEDIGKFSEAYKTLVFLQHDYKYITIFQRDDDTLDSFADSLVDCMHYVGALKGYDIYEGYAEIWLKTDKGSKMFILIPYDEGCVYYHG